MGLVDEQVPGRPQQAGSVPGPGGQVPHPYQRTLARVHEVSTFAAQRNTRHLSHHILARDRQFPRSAPRRRDRHLTEIDTHHALSAGGGQADVIETVAALQMHHSRRRHQQRTQNIELALGKRRLNPGLLQETLVLANVLLRGRLPGSAVQPHIRIHAADYRQHRVTAQAPHCH